MIYFFQKSKVEQAKIKITKHNLMSKRLEQLLGLYQQNSKDSFVIFALAKEYEKNNDKINALTYYEKLITDFPEYVGTYYHLGKLYENIEQIEKALLTYEKGISVAKSQGDMHALSELNFVRDELI
jgi:tetratricopeptide (TPR) repeat protein